MAMNRIESGSKNVLTSIFYVIRIMRMWYTATATAAAAITNRQSDCK